MSKRVSLAAGMVLISVPSIAIAKEDLEPRLQAVLACESVSANEARLQCFDRAILPLRQAMSRSSLVLTKRKGPLALEGVVKASGYSGANGYWVEFENGDRWSTSTKSLRKPPAPGTTLKLKKTLMGTYWMSGPKWSESQATFAGPSTDPGQ